MFCILDVLFRIISIIVLTIYLNVFGFLTFGHERIWWRLIQKSTSYAIKLVSILFYYYHWVDTTAGGLLVPEGIIRPVVSASALTTISKIHSITNLQLINFKILWKLRFQLPQCKVDLSWILAVLFRTLSIIVLTIYLNCLAFQRLGHERIWWRLIQKSASYAVKLVSTLFYYYHWVDTTAGGLLVPEGIIRPVVGASALTTISKIHFVTNLQLINFEIL